MINSKREVARSLKPLIKMDLATIEDLLEVPPRPEMGIWLSLFYPFSHLAQPPAAIAADLPPAG